MVHFIIIINQSHIISKPNHGLSTTTPSPIIKFGSLRFIKSPILYLPYLHNFFSSLSLSFIQIKIFPIMLSKRPRPMIGKLSELLVAGNRSGFSDMVTISPRGPLELSKLQSPRGLKNYDLGGVGLGIVAALEKSREGCGREILAKYAVATSNLNRSSPIPVDSSKRTSTCDRYSNKGCEELHGDNCEENYTYVTCHGQGKSITRVFYEDDDCRTSGHQRNGLQRCNNLGTVTVKESRPRCEDDFSAYPTSYFLSSCHLCRKKLDGKDIYMYRYKFKHFLVLFLVKVLLLLYRVCE